MGEIVDGIKEFIGIFTNGVKMVFGRRFKPQIRYDPFSPPAGYWEEWNHLYKGWRGELTQLKLVNSKFDEKQIWDYKITFRGYDSDGKTISPGDEFHPHAPANLIEPGGVGRWEPESTNENFRDRIAHRILWRIRYDDERQVPFCVCRGFEFIDRERGWRVIDKGNWKNERNPSRCRKCKFDLF